MKPAAARRSLRFLLFLALGALVLVSPQVDGAGIFCDGFDAEVGGVRCHVTVCCVIGFDDEVRCFHDERCE